MDISSITASASNTSSANTDAAKLADNFDDFLKLLTTQLKYQDPLSPMESNEFVAQLVQFTQVEQSIASNRNLEKLLEGQKASQTAAGLGYLGNTVEAASEYGTIQDGKLELGYAIGTKMKTTSISIHDLSGKLVYSTTGETAPGKHGFTWDGTALDGSKRESGSFRITVTGASDESSLEQLPTSITGRVTGVQSAEDGVLLSVGEVNLPMGNIISVKETPAAS